MIGLSILLFLLGIAIAAKHAFSKTEAQDTSVWQDLIALLTALVETPGVVFLLFGLVLLAVGADFAGLVKWIGPMVEWFQQR